MRDKLESLKLSNEGVLERERLREATYGRVESPWFIRFPFAVLCWTLDVVYADRPIQRYTFLQHLFILRTRPPAQPSPAQPSPAYPTPPHCTPFLSTLLLYCYFANNHKSYDKRAMRRFWVLETVARIPYFAFISMLHLYESLGWWRAGAALRKVTHPGITESL